MIHGLTATRPGAQPKPPREPGLLAVSLLFNYGDAGDVPLHDRLVLRGSLVLLLSAIREVEARHAPSNDTKADTHAGLGREVAVRPVICQ